jgi:hypothetical protein
MLFNSKTQQIATFNPDLKSVLTELQEGHYFFIIADRKKAFLFLFHNGEVELSEKIMHPGVRKGTRINSGDLFGKNSKLGHKISNQLHRHLQLIIQEAELLVKKRTLNGVFIGGHRLLFHLLEKELPLAMHEKLRGNFITELNIPEQELIMHCKSVIDTYIK